MPKGFLPNTDSGLLQWAQSFSTQITATPTAFGLVAAQATAFAALFTAYQTALNAATNESTRTKGTIAAKNDARDAIRNGARNLAKIVEGTPTVTDQQKLNLGLNVRAMPSPIPAPANPPVLEVQSVLGRMVRIRLHETQSGTKRGRPTGTLGASVFSYVGAQPPADVGAWKFEGSTGRTIIDVAFDTALAAGATVWMTAFWVGSRMESGPACT